MFNIRPEAYQPRNIYQYACNITLKAHAMYARHTYKARQSVQQDYRKEYAYSLRDYLEKTAPSKLSAV